MERPHVGERELQSSTGQERSEEPSAVAGTIDTIGSCTIVARTIGRSTVAIAAATAAGRREDAGKRRGSTGGGAHDGDRGTTSAVVTARTAVAMDKVDDVDDRWKSSVSDVFCRVDIECN